MREHGQGDVPVPARIPADLVLVEAALVLGGLETRLDGPAAAGDACQLLDHGPLGCTSQVIGEFVGAGQASASHHPAAVCRRIRAEDEVDGQPGDGPVRHAAPWRRVLLAVSTWHSARHPAPVLPLNLLVLPSVRPAMLANLLFAVAFGTMLLSVTQ